MTGWICQSAKGDYCLTEIREGEWYIRHSYFSKEHLRIGEYFNINTPAELYPYGARYVDLEVDVIQRAGENAFPIDQEKLEVLARKGCIGKGPAEQGASGLQTVAAEPQS